MKYAYTLKRFNGLAGAISLNTAKRQDDSSMTEVFPKAPITEALIEIRAQLPESVALSDLENLHARIRSRYPDKRARKRFEGKIEVRNENEPITTSHFKEDGYLFTSADGRQVAQFRLNGFTYNRLRPYSRWEDLYQEARSLWEVYRNAVKPLLVSQIVLRYINSVEIPLKNFDYDDYFTALPRIPQGLPQILQHFFTQVAIQFADQDATAVVIQTPSGKQDPLNTAILLDIGVFSGEINVAPEDQKIWEMLDHFRKIKNDVFFSHITEKTKELFR